MGLGWCPLGAWAPPAAPHQPLGPALTWRRPSPHVTPPTPSPCRYPSQYRPTPAPCSHQLPPCDPAPSPPPRGLVGCPWSGRPWAWHGGGGWYLADVHHGRLEGWVMGRPPTCKCQISHSSRLTHPPTPSHNQSSPSRPISPANHYPCT